MTGSKGFYLEKLRIEEIVENLYKHGFNVTKDADINGKHIDIIAQQGEKITAFEVKYYQNVDKEYIRNINDFKIALKDRGIDNLELIVVKDERKKQIDFEELNNLLFEYLVNNFPDDLDSLSSNTILNEISSLEIYNVAIELSGIEMKGSCLIDVELTYGGGGDDGFEAEFSFPAEFEVVLSGNPLSIDNAHIDIDTSEFYE